MMDLLAIAVGSLAGGTLLVLLGGLLLSLPVVLVQTVQVTVRREGLPVIYSLRSLGRRKVTVAATFSVLALVVFVFTAALMLAEGVRHTLEATGNPLNVKMLRENSISEGTSWLTEEQLRQLSVAPGVASDGSGKPLVSGELVVLIWAARRNATGPNDGANLTVRGVHPVAFNVHPARSLTGRQFSTGAQEIVIGRSLAGHFEGAELGGTMTFADDHWKVVGIADHGGTAHDSEVWGDIEVMSTTFKRSLTTATVRLTDVSAFDQFAAALEMSSRQVELVPKREAEYWRELSESYVGFVTLLGSVVGLIFSFGAILGTLNTMYAQVAARTRELGTLRAIGFKRRAILTSIVLESVLLSLAAGAVGVLAASLLGRSEFRLTTVETLSEITYRFHLTPEIVLGCLTLSALMGYAGALLPAMRAARIPIVSAVRAE